MMHKRQFLRAVATGMAGVAAFAAGDVGSPAAALPQYSRERIRRVRAAQTGGGVVVEVETDSGLTGHGFTAITNLPIVVSAVRDVIAANIIGQDALARELISERLHRLLVLRGLISGHAMHAISAVDLALWDIAGKLHNQPVWRLLGGARPIIQTYTTFGMASMNRDQLVEAARAHVDSGQQRLKMVVAAGAGGSGDATIEAVLREDAARIRAVREAVGPDVKLMIDANHGLNEFEARRFVEQIREFDVALFEEPLRGNDIRRLADFRRHCPVPIGAGQNEGHIARWRDMAVHDAVGVLQLNVCMCGGYTTAVKIAAIGQAFGLPIDNGGGYALFNMHLHAGVANGGLAEWHMSAVAVERKLYPQHFDLKGSELVLPERPGLGFDLNPDVLRNVA